MYKIFTLFFSALLLSPLAHSQEYPTRSVKIVVGFSAGGGSDFIARAIANTMSQQLGQSVVVENKPGAGGMIATRLVAKERPDGYTLLLGSAAAFVINPLLLKDIGYDPIKDFEPIGSVARFNYALLGNLKLPFDSLSELIQYAQKNPGKLNIGSAGIGSNTHLVAAALMKRTAIQLNHVPYKGTTGALNDLMAGSIDLLFDSIPTITTHIKSEKIKVFGTTGADRELETPNIPTLNEVGVKSFEMSNWFAIFAPVGIPKSEVLILNNAINRSLNDNELRKRFSASGNQPLPGSPAHLTLLIKQESDSYRELIRTANIEAH